MVLRGATSLRGALEGVGPENRNFFGPWNDTSEASAIWAQKSRDICRYRYLSAFLLSYTGRFFLKFTFMRGFWNNFQDHKQLSYQLLESHAVFRKKEQAFWRGLLDRFSQLVSDFIEVSRNFIFDFLLKKTAKNVKTISAHTKSTVLIFRTFKKIHLFGHLNQHNCHNPALHGVANEMYFMSIIYNPCSSINWHTRWFLLLLYSLLCNNWHSSFIAHYYESNYLPNKQMRGGFLWEGGGG